jgi:hypothetical protein
MPPPLPEREVSLQAANRHWLLQALQGLGITQVQVRYSGRHGRCIYCLVSTSPSDALAALRSTVVTQHCSESSVLTEQTERPPLLSALKDFALHWAELKHPRWTHDDGGAGVMTVDIATRQFTLEHNVFLTENFCYRLVD